MLTELYLDTARLGRMCSAARKAERDFAKLASQCGSSLYAENFLSHGFPSLPRGLRRSVPRLNGWLGISGLKQQLREFVGLPESNPVFIAGRSANLMSVAATSMFDCCENVLTTDAEWPPYRDILIRTAQRTKRQLTITPIADDILNRHVAASEVINALVRAYESQNCDGLFISDITFLGIRFPVRQIVDLLRRTSTPPKFVVVDGAQAANQFPVRLAPAYCDLYLMSTQKWLRAYQPLSVAFACNPHSHKVVDEALARCRRNQIFGDSLFDFCLAAERKDFPVFGETVNVTPLITASAALKHYQKSQAEERCMWRSENARRFSDELDKSAWSRVSVDAAMCSGAVLVRSRLKSVCEQSASQLRLQFHRRRICLSAYSLGLVRVSVPDRSLQPQELRIIERAFAD